VLFLYLTALMIFCVRKYEADAFHRGLVHIDQPRALRNNLPWPAWAVALAPDYTLFMPVTLRGATLYQHPVPPPPPLGPAAAAAAAAAAGAGAGAGAPSGGPDAGADNGAGTSAAVADGPASALGPRGEVELSPLPGAATVAAAAGGGAQRNGNPAGARPAAASGSTGGLFSTLAATVRGTYSRLENEDSVRGGGHTS